MCHPPATVPCCMSPSPQGECCNYPGTYVNITVFISPQQHTERNRVTEQGTENRKREQGPASQPFFLPSVTDNPSGPSQRTSGHLSPTAGGTTTQLWLDIPVPRRSGLVCFPLVFFKALAKLILITRSLQQRGSSYYDFLLD